MSRSLVAPVPDNDGGTPQPYVHCPQRPTCKGQHICPTACYPEQSKVGFHVLDTKPGSVSCKSAHRSFRPRCKACLLSRALVVSWRPRESPSWIKADLSTSRRAVSRSMRPPRSSVAPPAAAAAAAAAAIGSSPSTSDMFFL